MAKENGKGIVLHIDDPVKRGGYTHIENVVLYGLFEYKKDKKLARLSDGARLTYIRLRSLDFGGQNGKVWWSWHKLCALFGVSRATLARHLAELEAALLIDKMDRAETGHDGTTHYWFMPFSAKEALRSLTLRNEVEKNRTTAKGHYQRFEVAWNQYGAEIERRYVPTTFRPKLSTGPTSNSGMDILVSAGYNIQTSSADQGVRELVDMLGAQTLTKAHRELYSKWQAQGFEHEVIMYAAQQAVAAGKATPAYLNGILNNWAKLSVKTVADADQAMNDHGWRKEKRKQTTIEKRKRAGVEKLRPGVTSTSVQGLKPERDWSRFVDREYV